MDKNIKQRIYEGLRNSLNEDMLEAPDKQHELKILIKKIFKRSCRHYREMLRETDMTSEQVVESIIKTMNEAHQFHSTARKFIKSEQNHIKKTIAGKYWPAMRDAGIDKEMGIKIISAMCKAFSIVFYQQAVDKKVKDHEDFKDLLEEILSRIDIDIKKRRRDENRWRRNDWFED